MKPNWFSNKTELHFDGYPRSGNSFLAHLIREILKDVKTVHHLHKVAPIKISLHKNIPVYILIRHPKDAITSNYLKHFAIRNKNIPERVNLKLLKLLTVKYARYYKFVYENFDKMEIVPFEFLIKNPEQVIKSISARLNRNINENIIIEVKNSYIGATDKLGSSKPSPFKQKKKTELFEYLCQIDEYKPATLIYEKIINKLDEKNCKFKKDNIV